MIQFFLKKVISSNLNKMQKKLTKTCNKQIESIDVQK